MSVCKKCKLKSCGKPIVRQPGHTDHNWELKEFCDTFCRVNFSKLYGKRGLSDSWEPNEEELAEIERRKAECRQREVGHLAVCTRDE